MDRVQEFCREVVTSLGCDPASMSQPGITVAPDESRTGGVTVGYKLGERIYLSCDPAVEHKLAAAVGEMAPTLDAWTGVAEGLGGVLMGAARMQLLDHRNLVIPELPAGFTYRTISSADSAAQDMVAELVSVSSEDDLDEAEIEMDDLDEVIDVVVDSEGRIASYGSARLFDRAQGFGDIGSLTREEYRGMGLGVAVIATTCMRLIDEGIEPLYRCGDENAGSRALSAKLGFRAATRLIAYRFLNQEVAPRQGIEPCLPG